MVSFWLCSENSSFEWLLAQQVGFCFRAEPKPPEPNQLLLLTVRFNFASCEQKRQFFALCVK